MLHAHGDTDKKQINALLYFNVSWIDVSFTTIIKVIEFVIKCLGCLPFLIRFRMVGAFEMHYVCIKPATIVLFAFSYSYRLIIHGIYDFLESLIQVHLRSF